MTDNQFYVCVREVDNYHDRSAYISDMTQSSIWADVPDDDIPIDRCRIVGQIWDAVHRSIKQIASDSGLSQRKLAERFCIPYRTMENWCGGQNACPLYVRLMMQEILGLFQRS